MGQTIVADTKNSTLTLNGRTIEDTPDGDVFTLSYQNAVTTQTQGSNNGVVIKDRSDKFTALLTVRVLKYSSDDVFMNNAVNSEDVTVFEGSLKTNFTRNGVDGTDTYTMINGTVQDRTDNTINNTDGEDVSEYTILCQAQRSV